MTTGLAAFDTTVHETNEWLHGVAGQLAPCDRAHAYAATRAVLQALRDLLPLEAVLGLSAQLPMLMRGFFLEGWTPGRAQGDVEDPTGFVQAVAGRLPPAMAAQAEAAITAVFAVAAAHLDPGEVSKLLRLTPAPLHGFWPIDYRF